MKIEDAITECVATVDGNLSPQTAKTYKYGLGVFLRYLQTTHADVVDVPQLTVEHFIGYARWIPRQGYAHRSLGIHVAAVGSLIEWLTIENLLGFSFQDTTRYERAIKAIRQKREKFLPKVAKDGQAALVYGSVSLEHGTPVKERNVAMIALMLRSGCRIAEITGLSVGDLAVERLRGKVMGKGSKERVIYYDQETADLIVAYWNARGGCGSNSAPAFSRHDIRARGKLKPLSTQSVRNYINEASLIAGIEKGEFTPHSFRHNLATVLLRETHDIQFVQRMLGHSTPAVTMNYVHIEDSELEDRYRKIMDDEEE